MQGTLRAWSGCLTTLWEGDTHARDVEGLKCMFGDTLGGGDTHARDVEGLKCMFEDTRGEEGHSCKGSWHFPVMCSAAIMATLSSYIYILHSVRPANTHYDQPTLSVWPANTLSMASQHSQYGQPTLSVWPDNTLSMASQHSQYDQPTLSVWCSQSDQIIVICHMQLQVCVDVTSEGQCGYIHVYPPQHNLAYVVGIMQSVSTFSYTRHILNTIKHGYTDSWPSPLLCRGYFHVGIH